MENEYAIRAEHLSKVYNLYGRPMDRLKEALSWRGRRHHQEFHDRYGKFGNTWPQLKKYLES